MAKKLSPVPPGGITEKAALALDWRRWFSDVWFSLSRMLNSYDGDKSGTATLSAGTVTVSNVSVTSLTKVRITPQTQGAARGHLWVTLNPGVGFTITSDNVADNRQLFYELVEVF